mmetsp:Transcript_8261/g.12446  ORF Transcript_8261/g.12446 Transcript_8261/m.12446 type:complete len:332 (-) Transcript_8261:69-1064(-)|eukprot:CAMPEP_0203672126 /NCGR_PEP_ID=MMETSP0090-20130426/7726_1 /ASSEMBLY_ACC=CAM_ASM_001088 /TAXON_ID=426623 /ORGANISM="Chaetoceros affinis, Strain CCMP159" /LENGTH=331 /DNA_ID=CAMNT_0050537379 /DNA_START=86 /DNA_END=1081 /DNA_ORIENTATION=+
MEPASSSEDDSSIDEQTSNLPSGLGRNTAIENIKITSLDDLPSDDSCFESSSDSESEEDGDQNLEDVAMEDRVRAKNIQGIKRNPHSAAKKSKALALAQKRLSEMKRKRTEENGNGDKVAELKKEFKGKQSKHAPTCVSSNRKAYYSRGTPNLNSSGIGVEIGANRYKPRDPRYQSLSGHFDQNVFGRRYEFLEKIQDDEIENLRQKCKAWKIPGKKGQRMRKKLGLTSGHSTMEKDQAELNRLLQERASRADVNIRTAAKHAVKKRLRDEVASGKRGAFYLKKRDMKKMELEAKFEELKRIGGDKKVNEIMAKRRKRKMGRDSSMMPSAP